MYICTKKMAGIYIHIPFCKSRCVYCDFYSTTSLALGQRYVDALCREMENRCKIEDERCKMVETVYLGGGTPSQLDGTLLRQLFNHLYQTFDISPDAEVTIECNPDDVTEAFAEMLKTLPVNPFSQSVCAFCVVAIQPNR